jgi:hypothetical protein
MITEFIIFAICMTGCAWTAFYLGRNEGVEDCINYLVDEGVIELVEE